MTRTVTALTTMMLDLHLRVPSLQEKLVWFNDIENHFVIEFSDDGAPESKNTTMSIGSLTMWNFGSKVRSRDYHYPIHTVSCGEKEEVLTDMWRQHTDKMLLIEGSILNINNNDVTVEFQPSADQVWQCWANDELTTSATYPSIFHKTKLNLIGSSLGSKWKIPNMENRREDLQKLNSFCATVKPELAVSSVE